MARMAVKGIAHRTNSECYSGAVKGEFGACHQETQQRTGETKEFLSSLKNKVEFEFYLQLYEWMYWLAKQWFALFGVVVDENALIDSEF